MSLSNKGPLLDELAEVVLTKKRMEKREKELRAQLAEFFEAELNAPMVHNGHMFKMSMNKGRKTLDKEALEAVVGDLEPFYKTGKPFATLSITEVTEV